MNKNKFRIFVDGSYDDAYHIGTIAYNMQQEVVHSKEYGKVKMNIANKTFASQVRGCKNSFDAELCAIGLGFDTFKKLINFHPILAKVPVRVKSDNMAIIKYITKGQMPTELLEKNKITVDDGLWKDLNLLKQCYEDLKKNYSNFKLSYISSKENLAHNNAYEMLRWERLQRINSI